MTAPTHIIIGLAASIGLSRVSGLQLTALNLLWVFIGSLAPDIDADGGSISRPGRILRNFLPRSVADMLDGLVQVISKIINTVFGHRGPMHWPIIGVLLYAAGILEQRPWLIWFGWGYLWHILADALTVRGVPLLGPISGKFISLAKVRTGKKSELLVLVPTLFFVLISGFGLLPEQVRYWLHRYYQMVGP